MPDQKISELSAITAIDNATDVLPIVDTSATTTKKITLTQVKTSLALNNVDNTSDANKPVSSAQQTALDAKQATLVSGTNIKTINSTSILGSGNIAISSAVAWGGVTGTLSNQTDLQTALDGKVDENTAITGATKTKVTYDSKGLVTAGADATTADIADSTNKRYVTDAQLVVVGNTSGTNTGDNAVNSLYSGLAASKQDTLVSNTNIKTINSTSVLGSGNISVAPATGIDATAIADGTVTSIEFQYINSLTSNAQTQIDSKQATLVSGTNIKTINSTSLLGSGDIVLSASPSGVSGAIQFSNGSAFASDASNLFWDDTNNRLGVGTNAPTTSLQIDYASSTLNGILINQTGGTGLFSNIGFANNGTIRSTFGMNLNTGEVRWFNGSGGYFATIYGNGVEAMRIDGSQNVNIGATALGARLGIKGSGSTSATTSLLVQNSAGNTGFEIKDDRSFVIGNFGANGAGFGILAGNPTGAGVGGGINFNFNNGAAFNDDTNNSALKMTYNGGVRIPNSSRYPLTLGADTKAVASAQLEMVSTTQGFLPPRMTTTQKTNISSPAAGLVVYDSTTNKLCCYNGSTWNDLF